MNKPHALVIEDNAQNARVLDNLLARQGVTCTEVLNSSLVGSKLRDLEQPDVVFLDLEMPDLSGYDVFALLQKDPRFKDVPVVAYTVHISEINTAYEHGFHSFIAKPLDPDRFGEQLTRILSGEHVWER